MIILNVNVNLTLHLSFSGCTVGSIVTMPISGLLTRYDFDGGWPAVFYSFGKSHRFQKTSVLNAFMITSTHFGGTFFLI